VSPTPPGTGPLDPNVSGIDPDLMDGFIAAMDRAHAVMGEQAHALREQLRRFRHSESALAPIKEIEDWTGAQLPRLRTRNEVIRKRAPDWGPVGAGPGVVAYDEAQVPFASPDQSRREGAALAELFRRYAKDTDDKVITDELKERHRELLSQLLARKGDADFAAAFFAGIGAKATAALPEAIRTFHHDPPYLRIDDQTTSKEAALAALAGMFSTATTASGRSPGFRKVMDDLADAGEDAATRDGLSWLVSVGHFPTEWLAKVARSNVVLPMMAGTLRPTDITLGTTARFLGALAANPSAARAAVAGLGRDWTATPPPASLPLLAGIPRPTVGAVLVTMSKHVAGDARTADAFGRMLAGASGVWDERDGAHSMDASRFAFHVITAGRYLALHDAMKRPLAEVAGSYATEFAASAEALDPKSHKDSRFGFFDDELPGTKPAFRLSIQDGYRFLQIFADTDEHMEPFDKGMALLTRRLFAESVRIDRDRIAHPPADGSQPVTAVEHLFSRLGMVSGMEYAAMKVVRGTADLADREGLETFEIALDKGMDLALLSTPAGGLPAGVAAAAWMVFGWAVKDGLGAALEPEARLPKVNEKELTQTRAALYDIASALIKEGYTETDAPVGFQPPTNPLIVGGDGRLLPFSEINKDPKRMEAFLEWLKDNGSIDDDADHRSMGKLTVGAFKRFIGQRASMEADLAARDPRLHEILTGEK
jgi:hypothetical protein